MVNQEKVPRFGLSLSSTDRPFELAAQAEDLGFDYVTCGEHVLFPAPTRNSLLVLAGAAACTSRIGLLSAATLVPLYPPVLLAKFVAVLDELSKGRFNLGVGVGGEFPAEFDACDVPVRDRGARTDAALRILADLLEGGAVYEGEPDTRLNPNPITRPPFWIGGRSSAAIERAVRYGEYWMPYLFSAERLERGVRELRLTEREFGRTLGEVGAAVSVFCSVSTDGTVARDWLINAVGSYYSDDFSHRTGFFVVGTPDECRQQVRAYVDAGADVILLHVRSPQSVESEVVDMLASEVLLAEYGLGT